MSAPGPRRIFFLRAGILAVNVRTYAACKAVPTLSETRVQESGAIAIEASLGELQVDFLGRPVEVHDAKTANLTRSGRFCLRRPTGAGFPARL